VQVAAPVVVQGRQVGSIIVGDRPAERLSPDEIAALADQYGIDPVQLASAASALEPWTEQGVSTASGLAGQFADMIAQMCQQSEQLRQRADELAAIHDVASMLATRTNLQEILDGTCELLVKVMDLRAASIRLVDEESGELRIAAVANMSEAYLQKGPLRLADSRIDAEALGGKTVYIADVPNDPRTVYKDDARREGLVSGLVAPLACRGKAIGVLRAYTDRPNRFKQFQVALLQAIAAQVAAAIVNARLYREASDAERLERQVRLAAEVQRRMIPAGVPENPNYRFGCIYEPSSELGGDFYDFLEFPSGDIGVVIADVVGKGVPASLMMASARAALRSHAKRVYDVNDVISEVNLRLHKDTLDSEFVTAFYGVFSPDGRRLTYCNGGHEPVLLLRQGEVRELGVGGMVLGIDRDAKYVRAIEHLEPNDVLVMYTDGLLDATNYQDESYGRARLRESLRAHADLPARFLARQLLWDVRRFAGLAPAPDDMTIVVVRVSENAGQEAAITVPATGEWAFI
jgi:sigma-B regulation protein RsbU (phosphoserine phosphatase)